MRALKLLLAVALGIVTLAPSAVATAQSAVSLEEADSPDGTCELRINAGGPYEVSIDGDAVIVFPNESVVPVPQGSSVHYLREERTFGATAIGTVETCETFVPTSSSSSSSSGISAGFIAGAIVGVLVVLGVIWWFLIGAKRRQQRSEVEGSSTPPGS